MKQEQLIKEISIILDNSIDQDWGYNGEDEVMSESFNKEYAMSQITELLNKMFDPLEVKK